MIFKNISNKVFLLCSIGFVSLQWYYCLLPCCKSNHLMEQNIIIINECKKRNSHIFLLRDRNEFV